MDLSHPHPQGNRPRLPINTLAYPQDVLDHFDQVCLALQDPCKHHDAFKVYEQIGHQPDVVNLCEAVIHRRVVSPNRDPNDVVILHALALIRSAPNKSKNLTTSLTKYLRYYPDTCNVKRAIMRTCGDIYWEFILVDGGDYLQYTCNVAANSTPVESRYACEMLDHMMSTINTSTFWAESSNKQLLKRAKHFFIRGRLAVSAFHAASKAIERRLRRERLDSNDYRDMRAAVSVLHAVLKMLYENGDDNAENGFFSAAGITLNQYWNVEHTTFPSIIQLLFRVYVVFDNTPSAERVHILHGVECIYGCFNFFAQMHPSGFDDDVYSRMLIALVDGISNDGWGGLVELREAYQYAAIWKGISRICGREQCFTILGQDRIARFAKDSVKIVKLGLAPPEHDPDERINKSRAADCRELILDTWATFCMDRGTRTSRYVEPLKEYCREIVVAFVQYLLHIDKSPNNKALPYEAFSDDDLQDDKYNEESREYFDHEDTSKDDSNLHSAAMMVRLVSEDVAAGITTELTEHCNLLLAVVKGEIFTTRTLFELLEQICGLIQLSGRTLADQVEGETPIIPKAFLDSFQHHQVHRSGPHSSAHILLQGVIRAAEVDNAIVNLKGPHCDEASPRLATDLADALQHITRTYLANKEQEEVATAVIGGREFVAKTKDLVLEYGMSNILRRGFEPDVAASSAKLLVALSYGQSSSKSVDASAIAYWTPLLNMSLSVLTALSPRAIRNVGLCLAEACGDAVISKILRPAVDILQSACDPKQSTADAAERIISALNILWGVGLVQRNTQIHSFIFKLTRKDSGIIFAIHSRFADFRPEVGHASLETVFALTKSLLFANLSKSDFLIFAESCVQLIRAHCEVIRKRTFGDGEMTSKDIVVMLNLLEKLAEGSLDAQVAFETMVSVGFVMSPQLMTYPGVPEAYMQLLTTVIWNYASFLTTINESLKNQILQSLKLAICSHNKPLQTKGLEALSIFAEHTSSDASRLLDRSMKDFLFLILSGLVTDAFHLHSGSLALLAILHFNRERSWLDAAGREVVAKQPSFGPILAQIVPAALIASNKGALQGTAGAANPSQRRAARSEFAESVGQIVVRCAQ